MPVAPAPMLCTLVDSAFDSPDWTFEPKFDGLRVLARFDGASLTPWTQEGGFDEARAWALELARRTAEAVPKPATVDIRKAKRGDRVYIDVLQDARGHHAVPPYVLRAVPGATASTPLGWKEVAEGLDPKAFTLKKALARFTRRKTDPFEGPLRSFAGRRKKAARG